MPKKEKGHWEGYFTLKKNINLASAEELMSIIYGIGDITANYIITRHWNNINDIISIIPKKSGYMLSNLYNTGESIELLKKININKITKKKLLLINGINNDIADRIIKNKPYQSITDLICNKDIGLENCKIIMFIITLYYVEEEDPHDILYKKVETKKVEKIPHVLRTLVWKTYASDIYLSSKCYCCRSNTISIDNFICGHIESRHNGGILDLNNLRPICNSCNTSMGTINMYIFIKKYNLWQENNTPINDSLISYIKKLKNTTVEQNNDIRYKLNDAYIEPKIDIFINKIINEYIRDMYFDIMKYLNSNNSYVFIEQLSLIEYKESAYIHSWLSPNKQFIIKKEFIINPITHISIICLMVCKIVICDYSICSIEFNIKKHSDN